MDMDEDSNDIKSEYEEDELDEPLQTSEVKEKMVNSTNSNQIPFHEIDHDKLAEYLAPKIVELQKKQSSVGALSYIDTNIDWSKPKPYTI